MTQNAPATNISTLLKEGFDHIAADRRDKASRCFENIINTATGSLSEADKPLVAQAHNQLGIVAMFGGILHKALQHFEAAHEIGGFNPDQALNRGQVLMYLGRLEEAEGVVGKMLEKNPGNPQTAFQLGKIYMKQGRVEKATLYLEQAVKAAPWRVEILLELGISLELSGKETEAAKQYEKVREMKPDLYQRYYKKAEELKENYHYADALETLTSAGKILPDNPIPHHLVAILFEYLGEQGKAEEFLKKSLALHPTPESYGQLASLYEKSNALNDAWATANTGLQLFPDDDFLHLILARCERRGKKFNQALERLLKLERKTEDPMIKTQVSFLLGWLYDQQGDIDSAFDQYSRANKEAAVNANQVNIDREITLQYIRDFKHLDLSRLPNFPEKRKANRPREVVFLVGFPRSGTTLLNQILDSHPNLVGIEEKPTTPGSASLVQQMEAGYPMALEDINEEMVEKLRESYYRRLENFADYDANSVVIDKLPLNLIHLPLIWAMFPDAKIILALRHPMGSALSCFMHNFMLNNAMANMFTLENITAFYAKVMGLWQHYASVRDFKYHTVKYENVVRDIQGEARRLCEFLDVEWSGEMLKYARHARAKGLINTPSYHQVVQPLYSDSLERWRAYEKYLAPYREILKPYCDGFGYKL